MGICPLAAAPRRPGGRHITEFDVFEITATPMPMNADTRVLGWKSAWDQGDRRPSSDELRDRAEAIERGFPPVLIARFDC